VLPSKEIKINPSKIREEESCDERKRKSERTCSFLMCFVSNTHNGQKSPLQNDKYFS
jgi:hypothetical protein